jgi:hypothetical protein
MPSIEEQVNVLVGLLHAIPGADDLQQLRATMPCSYAETADWIQQGPNPRTASTLAALARLVPFVESARGFTPDDVAGLGQVDLADPRLPGFAADIRAAWPTPAQVTLITELLACGLRTLQQMVEAEPNMPAMGPPPNGGIGVREGLNKAAEQLGLGLGDVELLLGGFTDISAALQAFTPAAPTAPGRPLDAESVSAPEINHAYKTDGQIVVEDMTAPVTLPGGDGSGFLQSRLVGEGDPGTVAAGLYGYQYRIDLTGVTGGAGVTGITIPCGDPSPLTYPSAAAASPVYVITGGATGSVAPASVRIVGQFVTVSFDPPLPAGVSGYFVGFSSTRAPADSRVFVCDGGDGQMVAAKAPFAA